MRPLKLPTFLRALTLPLLTGIALSMTACATPPPVTERSVGFTASNGFWELTMLFDPVTEVYRVSGRDSYNLLFDDVQKPYRRPRPFFFMDSSRYGWYGEEHRTTQAVSQGLLKVGVEHAYYDFISAEALEAYLSEPSYAAKRWRTVITEDGIMVRMDDWNRSPERHAINISAYRLLINGQPPSQEFLRPYAHGSFSWLNDASNIRSFFGEPYSSAVSH